MNKEIINQLISLRDSIRWGTITKVYKEGNQVLLRVLICPSNIEIDDVVLVNQSKSNVYPNINTKCLIINPPSKNDDYYAFAFDAENANSVEEGELCLYSNANNSLTFKANGDIDIKSNSNIIKLNSNGIEITGNVKITGNLEVSGNATLTGSGTTIAGKQFLTHIHSGVLSGPATTGGVV